MNTNTASNNLDQLRASAAATMDEAKHDLSHAAHDVKNSAVHLTENLKSDMQQLLASAKTSGKAEIAAAAERLSEYMSAIADSANVMQQQGREKIKHVAQTTDTYVHDKPWQSVAIGAGVGAAVGFALGCLATRR
jgi:ElaB/YqjD/DUF883 family membrane-anchored ribosome-binding protein